MKFRHVAAAIAALALALPMAAAAQEDDPWSHVINMQSAGNWEQIPERPRPRIVNVEGQPFAQAFRVTASQGANPWNTQMQTIVGGDIATGDTVMVMLFARAERPAEGGSRLPLRLQQRAAPYTGLIDANFALTPEWKAFCASTVATQPFANDVSILQLHMATASHVVDIGPVFIFNFGQNYDASRLPHCPGG